MLSPTLRYVTNNPAPPRPENFRADQRTNSWDGGGAREDIEQLVTVIQTTDLVQHFSLYFIINVRVVNRCRATCRLCVLLMYICTYKSGILYNYIGCLLLLTHCIMFTLLCEFFIFSLALPWMIDGLMIIWCVFKIFPQHHHTLNLPPSPLQT